MKPENVTSTQGEKKAIEINFEGLVFARTLDLAGRKCKAASVNMFKEVK